MDSLTLCVGIPTVVLSTLVFLGIRRMRAKLASKQHGEDSLEEPKQRLSDAIESGIARGVPRGDLIHELDRTYDQASRQTDIIFESGMLTSDKVLVSAQQALDWQGSIDSQRQRLLGVMVDRNLEGKTLEDEGKLDQAISLYEANVRDKFDGTHPYDRLRIVYTKQRRYQDAIRVCQAYLALPDREHGQNKPHFKKHLEKLQSKIA
jgi:tetratricopeptide (TPR) repeat protein